MERDAVEIKKIFLNPGEFVLSETPVHVTTVLGSCVSITMVVKDRQFAGINHAVLPSGDILSCGKFVDQSLYAMVDFFRSRGVKRSDIVAKIFGGSDMFSVVDPAMQRKTVGAQNVRMALELLQKIGLAPVVMDVGGRQGRKLIFHSPTGDVFIKRIKKNRFADPVDVDRGQRGQEDPGGLLHPNFLHKKKYVRVRVM